MIMLQSDHPDIIEFIISKMQNPRILRYLMDDARKPILQIANIIGISGAAIHQRL